MDKQLFKELIAQFLQYLRTDLNRSVHTCRAYRIDLHDVVNFWEQPEYQALDIKKAIYTYLKIHLDRKTWDKKSLARKISCLNTFERFALTHDSKLELELTRPHIIEERPQFISIQDIVYVLDTVPEAQLPTQHPHRDKAIFELLYATGIRPSELIAVQLLHLNLPGQTLVVQSTQQKERVVPFGSKAARQLQQYMSLERPTINSSHEHLFLNHKQEPLTTRSIQRICNMFGALLPHQPSITPSLLRHSCAIHLLQEGSDLALVQELLGTTRVSAEKYLPLVYKDHHA